MKKRLLISGALFLFFLAALIGRGIYAAGLGSDAARLWQGESATAYRRISVYFNRGSGVTANDAVYSRSGIVNSIAAADETAKALTVWGRIEESRILVDSRELYCQTVLSGEDFFLMRRFLFLSGGDYGFGKGKIVLNEYAAYALFGSADCVGMMLKRNDEYEKVHGVVRDGEKTPIVYAYLADREGEITFFEAILPEYVNGYARNVIDTCFYEDENTVIRENDLRYKTENLRKELKKEFDESEQPLSFRVPFWEYRERRAERILTVWNVAAMILSLPFFVSLVPILWDLGTRLIRWGKERKEARKRRRSLLE